METTSNTPPVWLELIKTYPTTTKTINVCGNNMHESCFRCYSTLQEILDMIDRWDSKKTIIMVAQYLWYNPRR
jgi:hypothetical protein